MLDTLELEFDITTTRTRAPLCASSVRKKEATFTRSSTLSDVVGMR